MDETFNADNLQIWEIHMTDHHALLDDIKNAVSRFLDDLQKVKSNPFITEDELLPAEIPEITKRIIAFEQQVSRMKELEKKIKDEKDRLKTAMERAGVKKWETPNGYKITLIPDSDDKVEQEESFNAERFMAEHPELVEQYTETKDVIKKGKKGFVRITAPKEDK
jgi:predicted nuclease with TOPRIM domain